MSQTKIVDLRWAPFFITLIITAVLVKYVTIPVIDNGIIKNDKQEHFVTFDQDSVKIIITSLDSLKESILNSAEITTIKVTDNFQSNRATIKELIAKEGQEKVISAAWQLDYVEEDLMLFSKKFKKNVTISSTTKTKFPDTEWLEKTLIKDKNDNYFLFLNYTKPSWGSGSAGITLIFMSIGSIIAGVVLSLIMQSPMVFLLQIIFFRKRQLIKIVNREKATEKRELEEAIDEGLPILVVLTPFYAYVYSDIYIAPSSSAKSKGSNFQLFKKKDEIAESIDIQKVKANKLSILIQEQQQLNELNAENEEKRKKFNQLKKDFEDTLKE